MRDDGLLSSEDGQRWSCH